MKRHDRPYGCTHPHCWKSFGSKNDWKRHENTQHFLEETWRCQRLLPEQPDLKCPSTFKTKDEFCQHLRQHHDTTDLARFDEEAKECHIHSNGQSHIWCGFCVKIIHLHQTGIQGVDARFDHIAEHFRKGERHTEWIPVDSNVPRVQQTEGGSKKRPSEVVKIVDSPRPVWRETETAIQLEETSLQADQDLTSSVGSLDSLLSPGKDSTTKAATSAKRRKRKRSREEYGLQRSEFEGDLGRLPIQCVRSSNLHEMFPFTT